MSNARVLEDVNRLNAADVLSPAISNATAANRSRSVGVRPPGVVTSRISKLASKMSAIGYETETTAVAIESCDESKVGRASRTHDNRPRPAVNVALSSNPARSRRGRRPRIKSSSPRARIG